MTGNIPAELGQLDSLVYLWLHYNNQALTGPIPLDMGRRHPPLRRLELLTPLRHELDGNHSSVGAGSSYLTLLWTNRRPQAPNNIELEHTLEPGVPFTYTVPAFTDRDGDTLTYYASLEDGSALPNWLTFDFKHPHVQRHATSRGRGLFR